MEKIEIAKLVGSIIILFFLMGLPFILAHSICGKYTVDLNSCLEEKEWKQIEQAFKNLRESGWCEWGISNGYDNYPVCTPGPCKRMNTDGLNCTPNKKYSQGGFLTTSELISDVTCKDYGDLKQQCIEEWGKEEYCNTHNDTFYCED